MNSNTTQVNSAVVLPCTATDYAHDHGDIVDLVQVKMPIQDPPPPTNGKSEPGSTHAITGPVSPLSPSSRHESCDLQACEAVIGQEWESFAKVSSELVRLRENILQREWDAFVKVGEALRRIRDAELFRPQYPSFPAYCSQKWHFKKAHAYRLMSAAETVKCLSPLGRHILPRNEKQARLYNGLDPEQKRLAGQKVKSLAGDGEITIKHIKAAVAEFRPPKKDCKPRLKRGVPLTTPSADDWQKAHEIIKRTLYFVKQGGNHPENTEQMLKLLDEHLCQMEEARREPISKSG